MESIGEKLRIARETRDISLEQAARDTHIAKHYLLSLEAEDFDEFPGETYLIGFLRSYAHYLELNDDEMVNLYRNIQIQEQPAPIAELLNTGPSRKRIGVYVGIAIATVVVVGAVLLFLLGDDTGDSENPPREEVSTEEPGDRSEIPTLEQEFLERRFTEGERIAIPVGDETAVVEFVSIDDVVTIGAANQVVRVLTGDQETLDLSGDGTADVRISIRQIGAETDPPTVVARLDRVVQSPSGSYSVAIATDEQTSSDAVLIAQFNQPEEYFVEADFRGYTMFRYEIDSKERRERFFQRGDRVRDSVEEEIRLWASNGGNVRLRVAGVPVELGNDGEVVAVEIRWNVDVDGRYNLELYRLQ